MLELLLIDPLHRLIVLHDDIREAIEVAFFFLNVNVVAGLVYIFKYTKGMGGSCTGDR